MNDHAVKITAAAVSDRGLSEKRPLNEDSYLADSESHIFAVADGVGGAQAGEVASQTAMEVLEEAFRHQDDTTDIEDLMEIAIQRANTSIHSMAREHPKLAMMATTIVALHLDGRLATIGHVGDSRLYRLTPDGRIHRETTDHSVVEEEVRAGRMTAAQAAHHPSRNVISRALGAEDGVEVDMKTIEVTDGTSFLLCSDGITRHIPDNELRTLLAGSMGLEDVCGELKKRCYERGAEDNLTAVVVRVGDHVPVTIVEDDEPTIASARAVGTTSADGARPYQGDLDATIDALRPLNPVTSGEIAPSSAVVLPRRDPAPLAAPPKRGIFGTLALAILFLVILAGVGAAAYFVGMYKQRELERTRADANPAPQTAAVDPEATFQNRVREVDRSPGAMAARFATEKNGKPLDSTDPEFVYLYGRALLLSGKYPEAGAAFKRVSELLKNAPARDELNINAKLGAAVVALKTGNATVREAASKDLDQIIEKEGGTSGQMNANNPSSGTGASPSVSPVALPR